MDPGAILYLHVIMISELRERDALTESTKVKDLRRVTVQYIV